MTNWNDILKNRKEGKALLELLEGLEEDIKYERLKSEESIEKYGDFRGAKGFRADVDSRLAGIMRFVNNRLS
jgi:hypothetical protein